MKLRLSGDSVRLRLSPADVRQLAGSGAVTAATHFGPASALVYRVSSDPEIQQVTAALAPGELYIHVPAALVAQWASTDQVGISATQPCGSGSTLAILIEKDFECLDKARHKSGEALFPHPAAISK